MPIIPEQYLKPVPGKDGITYSAASSTVSTAYLLIVLPSPGSEADMEDLESFEVLLRQYKSLGVVDTALANITAPPAGSSSAPLAEELRGRLMLVNEDNGEIMGELNQEFDVEEDKRLAAEDRNKPVVLNFGDVVDGFSPTVKVQTVPEAELDDWMLRGAHELRYTLHKNMTYVSVRVF